MLIAKAKPDSEMSAGSMNSAKASTIRFDVAAAPAATLTDMSNEAPGPSEAVPRQKAKPAPGNSELSKQEEPERPRLFVKLRNEA